ncbi:MAG: glycosyltransferase family 4 protein [candidate division WOR-3 bacterium]
MHIQLIGFNENLGYQENLLVKYHKKLGHDVSVITSTYKFFDKVNIVEPGWYNYNGIRILRLPYPSFIPLALARKFKIVNGLKKALNEEKPDLVFLHGGLHGLESHTVLSYIKRVQREGKRLFLVVDSHADEYNSARKFISKLLHKTLWAWIARRVQKNAAVIYAINDGCKNFLIKYYKLDPLKIDLLPLGGDPEILSSLKSDECKAKVRQNLNIKTDDFVLITGGKLDRQKKIIELMKLVANLESKNVKLIVFGSIAEEIKEDFWEIVNKYSDKIIYVGWLDLRDMYMYFLASDLAVFPGTQSAIWAHVIFCGLPAIFWYWPGMINFSEKGFSPCILVSNMDEIDSALRKILADRDFYLKLKANAKMVANDFSYELMAQKVLEVIEEQKT